MIERNAVMKKCHSDVINRIRELVAHGKLEQEQGDEFIAAFASMIGNSHRRDELHAAVTQLCRLFVKVSELP